MKRFILIISLSLFISSLFAQGVPSVMIKDIKGKAVNTKAITQNDGKPVLVCFWATWCKPCIKEFNAINEEYDDWVEETGVKVIAISIDDARSSNSVAPFVNARGWEFPVYLDPNGDFKRAMNVGDIPHTFLLDKNGKVVWQHTTYLEGDEAKTFEVIKKVAKGQAIK
ncbi:MAG: TlpA family protein disulfide reductase [Bacteroidales bacterium]|nr:TlpA family protein disulfide reductase [Bacteroidales bacterium]